MRIMSTEDKAVQDAKKAAIHYAQDWGSGSSYARFSPNSCNIGFIESSLPPTLLATLITALHARPFQPLPMLFPPVLLFSTYLNLSGFVIDSAGLTAAWSGLYLLLARRRRIAGGNFVGRMGSRFGARGLTRGAAMGLATVNLMGGGVTYAFGRRKTEEDERKGL